MKTGIMEQWKKKLEQWNIGTMGKIKDEIVRRCYATFS
jgi:hypothetical protein